jgi:hypothetical protein
MQGYPNLIAPFLKGICHAHIDRVDAIYERPDGSLIVFHGKYTIHLKKNTFP